MDQSILEPIIADLEKSLASLEFWLTVATGLVVLGLVLEYSHAIPDAIADLKKKAWSWKPLCIIAGGILIVVGVGGELAIQFFAGKKETALRKANDAIFARLNAETAEANAKTEGLKLEVEEQKQKTARFQKEADQARLALDIQVRAQGPRWRLLAEAAPLLQKRLRLFSGQQAELVMCGPSNRIDAELDGVFQWLMRILNGAEWKVRVYWDERCLYGPASITVSVDSKAGEKTRNAADLVSKELAKIIPFSQHGVYHSNTEGIPNLEIIIANYLGKDSDLAIVASHPDSVVIGVYPH